MNPQLSIIIPARDKSDPLLLDLLHCIKHQEGITEENTEILVMTEGNSEEAKAHGILKAKGEYLCFLCCDNYMRDRNFLQGMMWYLRSHAIDGVYTYHYDHVWSDKALSRYFALLGANDPLCWWLGKADRKPWWDNAQFRFLAEFPHQIPSIGDNGFFIRRVTMLKVNIVPSNHFPMDAIEDLRRIGHYSYLVTPDYALWHKSGESWLTYFKNRYRYTRDLYFSQLSKRRWIMVSSTQDWLSSILFALSSVLILPQLYFSIKGYLKVKDWAWFLHPVVCFILTFIYGWAWLKHLISRPRSLYRALVGTNVSNAVSTV